MKKSWNDLQSMTIEELQKLKESELERINSRERERQGLIRDILVLQEFKDLGSTRTPV